MWNISFKTFIKDEIQEEGFDTSFEKDLEKVLIDLDDKFDLINIDKVELTINKFNLKKEPPALQMALSR